MYTAFLIKYAEIGVKGKNRYLFEDALCKQIRIALNRCEGEFTVPKTDGRIFVYAKTEFDYDEVIDALTSVFGIFEICPMEEMEVVPVEEIGPEVVKYVDRQYKDKNFTFKVNTRRARKSYPGTSMEINAELGGYLLDAYEGLKVDVHDPEVVINVEIREKIYIYSTKIPGLGGMPLGTNGKAMLLLSGGIDSPVAGYMVSKRGVKLDAVYFHAPPYTSERAKEKVVDLAREIAKYTGPINLHVINFTDIQLYIYEKCPHDELTIIMRRYMMMIAENIAKRSECYGLITGESLGQVASQTIQSLSVTNEVCTLPVFRPLIGFDKQDIISISEKIGTYETSILPFEDCCTIFVAKHPVTKPNLNVIKKHEENLKENIDELLKKAYETDEVITVQYQK
ncbi:MAG: tRNA 4-thiouridine(8) synthase ThiI [Lachnospiraceae bacterium]|nr:tRNA 4-thiouridine(8) synthase ThiI [Lachnospiraceae bacterium]